jgi:hypothetical protein
MEEFIYKKINMAFKNLFLKFSNNNNSDAQVRQHENRMKESMAQKDLYQDKMENFESKTSQILTKYQQFEELSGKDEKIVK